MKNKLICLSFLLMSCAGEKLDSVENASKSVSKANMLSDVLGSDKAKNVRVAPDGAVYVLGGKLIDGGSELYRRKSGSLKWEKVGTTGWLAVAPTSSEEFWGLKLDHKLYKVSAAKEEWVEGRAYDVAAFGDKSYFLAPDVNPQYGGATIWKRTGTTWKGLAGRLTSLSVGVSGRLVGINSFNQLFYLNESDNWIHVGGAPDSYGAAVSKEGVIYVLTGTNVESSGGYQIFEKKVNDTSFSDTQKRAMKISGGLDTGVLWAVKADGKVGYWNGNDWTPQ